jgi:hypothetical protein
MSNTNPARLTLAVLAAIGVGAVSALPAAAGSAGRQPPPQILEATESSAEDLIDYALDNDRSRVVAGAQKLNRTAAQAVPVLRGAGPTNAQLSALRQRAARVASVSRSGRFITVALAANAVSELMPGLYSRFSVAIPPAVLSLDYLEREAQLRARAGQKARVPALVERLATSWSGLRARVRARGGRKEAAAFDKHVAAMKRLAPAAGVGLQREADVGLELVDDLENVFG